MASKGRPRKDDRLGKEKLNFQNSLMKIIDYTNTNNIIVEFQDEYKAKVHSNYQAFERGGIKNPYYPSVYNVGMIGNKYKSRVDKKMTKEYTAWCGILQRCFCEEYKNEHITYKDVICCDEWLLFENFYEWLHSQSNFNQWLNGHGWDIDKDILYKNNKIYSPETCCLVPHNVNVLFMNRKTVRGNLPLGVAKHGDKFRTTLDNPLQTSNSYLGVYDSQEEAFNVYKERKENIIKQIAKIEFDSNNITKQCYNAMVNYKIEITD